MKLKPGDIVRGVNRPARIQAKNGHRRAKVLRCLQRDLLTEEPILWEVLWLDSGTVGQWRAENLERVVHGVELMVEVL